ncbi:DinB family protein [Paenibacillus radicis (ex Gao et al. 2016)]|uniref:DNA damage-inducible protein DinB n=1 Tax=Paenibacillus radicis (ex Gao et al. 2016) TaxID=1737354 RepID=A0A917GYP6_9BACL|nr:DinB family protein [Paenibacillus radicis (ex Gao et al. 2016)]GGG60774.1 DNA damage-inducible protein DinB [Paenibacillus radicis (ex Gao et al. 2016)]
MEAWFRYNWMVRDQWYQWCEELPHEELIRQRTGGTGSLLKTFFHIADVEWSWIQQLQGKPDELEDYEQYQTLERVKELDRRFRAEVEPFVKEWEESMETRPHYSGNAEGDADIYSWGEVMRHIIAHEIHHIGQLSVWAREIGKPPVSANFIGKGLIKPRV